MKAKNPSTVSLNQAESKLLKASSAITDLKTKLKETQKSLTASKRELAKLAKKAMPKKTQSKNTEKKPIKEKYKVINWREYNEALKDRGKLTLWLSPALLKIWKDVPQKKTVGEQQYPDELINFF